MIVVDASAALSALLNKGPARQAVAGERLHSAHLVDSEVASGLRRMVASRRLTPDEGWNALNQWRQLGIQRYAVVGVLDRVWALRDNLSTYDASYIALAELLSCPLVTADARLSRAPGIRCTVTVVPR